MLGEPSLMLREPSLMLGEPSLMLGEPSLMLGVPNLEGSSWSHPPEILRPVLVAVGNDIGPLALQPIFIQFCPQALLSRQPGLGALLLPCFLPLGIALHSNAQAACISK